MVTLLFYKLIEDNCTYAMKEISFDDDFTMEAAKQEANTM